MRAADAGGWWDRARGLPIELPCMPTEEDPMHPDTESMGVLPMLQDEWDFQMGDAYQ